MTDEAMVFDRRKLLGGALTLGFSGSVCLAAAGAPGPALRPSRLKKGDRVGLINPAGATAHRVDVEIVEESLRALGLEPVRGAHILDRYGYLAGRDADRAADVMAFFEDPSIRAILAIRGGWGCARILPLLDYDRIRSNPKIIVGYSDVTALLIGIFAKTGLVTFHGPVGVGPWNQFTVDYFKRVLFDAESVVYQNPQRRGDNLTLVQDRVQTIFPGTATGRLIGGNLTVLSAIVGSPYLPAWQDSILFVEDVEENIYRVDRMLTQLRLAGILARIRGFIFGKCTECGPGEGFGSLTLEQVFDDHIVPLKIPAWQGAMIGHITEKFTVPIGIQAEIDSVAGTARLLEAGVA